MMAFVGSGRVGESEDWGARAIPFLLARASMSAIAPIAGSAAAVAMLFIGWLPHQVITELNLRSTLQTSRLDQLNMMRERINLTLIASSYSRLLALVRQSAPFPRRHPHPLGKYTPEC